jgi:hypothetical protein
MTCADQTELKPSLTTRLTGPGTDDFHVARCCLSSFVI